MAEIFDTRQEQFLTWLCTPPNGRVPSSQAALAKHIGVDETTLRRWKNKPAFKQEWKRRIEDLQGSPERTQQLLDNLFERAIGGDNNSAKLYLQATGRLAPVQLQVEHKTNVTELSDSELAELISATASQEQMFRLETKVKAPVNDDN
ncbi:Homeodomain, phBC6A51-type [uncultured Caudovirales phage]|uniref:Homeodomain, phBC6A51-type n=1 Tax=uncultured Caudovirales phage TaxID=2100421 RepID=A0A6J5MYK3_9CAUD|nr:Homeodomain, phBC6A51-type [uncultured Caudovirales phage]CAB4184028.1 Homeodomain, phBC6A51-type [uncultured Caudovirales phage]CAB4214385.1 Homeodomain, phBC6A51-type [uncultured Caudovirales phage]CAB5228860.1 Homeodomain, phBC6A51-type [uncultured Caudovirales phage]